MSLKIVVLEKVWITSKQRLAAECKLLCKVLLSYANDALCMKLYKAFKQSKVQNKYILKDKNIFLILVNNPKEPLHEKNPFKTMIFQNRIIKKPLKS